jgi:hypothetical protein
VWRDPAHAGAAPLIAVLRHPGVIGAVPLAAENAIHRPRAALDPRVPRRLSAREKTGMTMPTAGPRVRPMHQLLKAPMTAPDSEGHMPKWQS